VVSYDVIGQDVLDDIEKVEKRGFRHSILAFLEQDDDSRAHHRRSPPQSTTPAPSASASPPAATTSHSINVSPANSTVTSAVSTPSPGGGSLPPEFVKKEKKNLRAGRKKVNITTTGDILPIVKTPGGDSKSSLTHDPLDRPSHSTVETLQQIMVELERKEAEAALRHEQQQQQQLAMESAEKVKPKNRYFCCFSCRQKDPPGP
jgi:hypothetical protein